MFHLQPWSYPVEPPLPKQRASKDRISSYIGNEYAGPI